MSTLHNKLQASPLLARVLPFVVFLVLTSAQGSFGPDSQFWVYLLKTLVGVWMIWTIWPLVGEMRWALSIEAVGGGLLVFLLWIGLDFPYPKLLEPDDSWDLQKHFGEDLMMFWLFAGTRIVGSTLVVPLLEEVDLAPIRRKRLVSRGGEVRPTSRCAGTVALRGRRCQRCRRVHRASGDC